MSYYSMNKNFNPLAGTEGFLLSVIAGAFLLVIIILNFSPTKKSSEGYWPYDIQFDEVNKRFMAVPFKAENEINKTSHNN